MNILTEITFLIILVVYFVFCFTALKNVRLLRKERNKQISSRSVPVSMITCIHNEEHHLPSLLSELSRGNTLHQYIFVLDGCTDHSASILKKWKNSQDKKNILILESPVRQGKKKSIMMALEKTTGEWIYLRDADTFSAMFSSVIPPKLPDSDKNPDCVMVAGLVLIRPENTFISWFQFYEGWAMQIFTLSGIAGKRPPLIAAANLMVKKTFFAEQKPYEKNFHIPGGDDMFLLDTVWDKPGSVYADTESILYTYPKKSFFEMIRQRIRWGAKSGFLKNRYHHQLAFIIFLANLSVILILATELSLPVKVIFLSGKGIIDYLFLFLSLKTFGQRMKQSALLLSVLIYPFYLVPTAFIALISHVIPKK
jgi:glycosyltransferase involved in cell wall biosynthesis